jgi:DNA polymerase-1
MKRPIAYDTETSGTKRHKGAYMFFFTSTDWDGESEAHRVLSQENDVVRDGDKYLRWLWSDENKDLPKVMHNARFDIGMTEDYLGRSLYGHEIHETMALGHLFMNTHPTLGLKPLGHELFGFPLDQDVTRKYLNDERGMLDCPDWLLEPYGIADTERTMLLYRLFHPKLKEMGFESEYEMERELVWTTKAIEERGMQISVKRCEELRDECYRKEQEALEDWYSVTRDRHKPTDGILRHILYKKLGLPVIKKTKNAGLPSVDADTLKQLEEKTKHPIFDIILRRRAYHTGAVHAESYIRHADADGVIHPSIHPYGADTGRETCKDPNLQNVSKDTTRKARYPIRARRCFRPRPGYVNFHLDYSGIEWRLAVNESGDPELVRAINAGEDPHAVAAAIFYAGKWRRAQSDTVARKSLRDAAKSGNYCKMYGGGDPKLAATVGVPLDKIVPRSAEYNRRFPKLATLASRIITEARNNGYITTPFGRRLYVPQPHAALNYYIQGTAASILKRAQNRVHRYLEDATGGEAGICLPIHDEIIVEWPRKRLRDAGDCLREIRALMIDFPEFDVPMDVDCKRTTADWSRPAKVKIPA